MVLQCRRYEGLGLKVLTVWTSDILLTTINSPLLPGKGREVSVFGTHYLRWHTHDNEGVSFRTRFEAINRSPHPVLAVAIACNIPGAQVALGITLASEVGFSSGAMPYTKNHGH